MNDVPNIFEYIDFRKYLTDWRNAEKTRNPGLTHEYLSAKLGQKGRAYFGDIEKGRRSVGPEVLDRLIRLLGLKGSEAKYFRAIVGYGQPATYDEREYWFEQAIQLNNTPKKLVDRSTYNYYKKWYYSTIRAFLETCDIRDDYGRVAEGLYHRVTREQVREAVDHLLALGLVARTAGGYLKPTDKVLTTGNAVGDELLRQYQIANCDILRSVLENSTPDQHDSTQLTLSVSAEGAERIGRRIRQFRSEILSIVHKDEKKADRVYKIALHVYPESRKVRS